MYQNILVPIDGSETAGRGLDEAIELARTLGARIRLLYVLNTTPWIAADTMAAVAEDLVTQLRTTGECILHQATTAVRAADVQVEQRLIEALGDRAGEMIVAEANSWPAHLIACGTHGRRGLKRLLMGSDAEYIVRHSPVPVPPHTRRRRVEVIGIRVMSRKLNSHHRAAAASRIPSGLRRLVLGNTAEPLLDRLPCNLPVVKPRRFANRIPASAEHT